MQWFNAFFVALQFLTRIPVHLKNAPGEKIVGRSLVFYPAIGLIVGGVLASALNLGAAIPDLLRAAIIVGVWVAITGALHLDGVADTADAWVGGYHDRERALAIMKDPRSGPMGVAGLVLVLLLKFAALAAMAPNQWLTLIAIPIIARSFVVLLLLSTTYARASGLGKALIHHAPRRLAIGGAFGALLVCILVTGAAGVVMVIASTLCFFWCRYHFVRRFGGVTGDTAGALIEYIEVIALVFLVIA